MIKLFEEYNQYYTKSGEEEFYDLCHENTLVFTDDEINILNKELEVDISLRNNVKYDDKHTYINFTFNKNYTKERIYMYKIPDEWYIVEHDIANIAYYKCDQIEGLLKCLNDIYDKTI